MSATKTVRLKTGGGNVDPEYQKKWERFAEHFRRVRVGGQRAVRGRVYQIIGPVEKEVCYNGNCKLKDVFEVRAELRHPGMEGLRFFTTVTASLAPNAKLNHLYAAVTGDNPPEDTEVDFDPSIVTRRDILLVIKKGEERQGDNKGYRGGFYADVVEFEPIIDELDNPLDEPKDGAYLEEVPAGEGRRPQVSRQAPEPAPEDIDPDDVPF